MNQLINDTKRLLFVRVGRMMFYAGPQTADDGPRGGGKYNLKNLGHEAFNFFQGFGGTLYATFGIVRPKVANPSLDLRRIDPSAAHGTDSVGGVLVILVAPYEDGQRVVGWYRDATVFRVSVPYPADVESRIQQHLGAHRIINDTFNAYRIEAETARAVLLPEDVRIRMPKIPRGSGGLGQSNVCYAREAGGAQKSSPWIWEIAGLVSAYNGVNLLTTPEAGADNDLYNMHERAQGFVSNAKIRRLVEEYAMTTAKQELCKLGFENIRRTAEYKCYDYICERDDVTFYVEVKGTQTTGESIILTKNEVEHAKHFQNNSIFIIVRSIKVEPKGDSSDVSQGTPDVHNPWILDLESVQPTHFKWSPPIASPPMYSSDVGNDGRH